MEDSLKMAREALDNVRGMIARVELLKADEEIARIIRTLSAPEPAQQEKDLDSVDIKPSADRRELAVVPQIAWTSVGAGWSDEDLRKHNGHCIVGLYNDGSGSAILYVGDGVLVDAEGDEHPWSFVPKQCSDIMRIPDSYQLWCECWDEDPYTLPRAPAPAAENGL